MVTVCEVGYRAAHSAFALRLAGFDDVRVYDASRREWDDRGASPWSLRRPYLSDKRPIVR